MMRKKILFTFMIFLTFIFLTGCAFFSEKITYYTVRFYANETLIKTESVRSGYYATYPEAPEVRGYTFKGWDVEPVPVLSSLQIHALYEINHYTITYVNDGNPVDNPTSYTVLDEFVLNNPTKDGIAFLGWLLDGQKVEKIEKGTIGDLTLIALFDIQSTDVFQDKTALENEYQDLLSGIVERLDPLPVIGINKQSKITWQSDSTAVSVDPDSGAVTITKGDFANEVVLYAIVEKDNFVELCMFRFTIPANS